MRKLHVRQVRARRAGMATIEFALIVVVFTTLLLGTIQFGIYLNASNAVIQIAREGGRYAATKSACTRTDVENYITTTTVIPPQLRATRMTTSPGSVELQYYDASGTATATRTVGGQVKITVTYDMRDKLLMGPGAFFIPLSRTYVSTSTFRVED